MADGRAARQGNPAAGTNEKGTWASAYTIYPAVNVYQCTTTIRIKGSSFTYTPPTGFSAP